MRVVHVFWIFVSCLFLTPASVWAQAEDSPSFEQRRKAVMAFVHDNHPQMEQLLLTLEKRKPIKFESAVMRVEKALANMSGLEEKNPEKYLLKVERWKIKSDVEILTARIGLGGKDSQVDVDKLREEIVVKFNLMVDLRRKILEAEKQAVEQRLEKVSRSIDRVEQEREAFVKKHLQSVESTLEKLESSKLKLNNKRESQIVK